MMTFYPVKIAILASGSGTNAEQLFIKFPSNANNIATKLLVCNKINAPVLKKAEKHNIPRLSITNNQISDGLLLKTLLEYNIEYVILAGFLRKIPKEIVAAFKNKILNIHPSLLPKHGGKGMYGDNVHKTVIENKEKISGISIHLVNDEYDKGALIFQKTCDVVDKETVATLANKIHTIEHQFYGEIIQQYIEKQIKK